MLLTSFIHSDWKFSLPEVCVKPKLFSCSKVPGKTIQLFLKKQSEIFAHVDNVLKLLYWEKSVVPVWSRDVLFSRDAAGFDFSDNWLFLEMWQVTGKRSLFAMLTVAIPQDLQPYQTPSRRNSIRLSPHCSCRAIEIGNSLSCNACIQPGDCRGLKTCLKVTRKKGIKGEERKAGTKRKWRGKKMSQENIYGNIQSSTAVKDPVAVSQKICYHWSSVHWCPQWALRSWTEA